MLYDWQMMYRVLLAIIRDKGIYPCPRCEVHKSLLDRLGLWLDITRQVREFWKYYSEKVAIARRSIYGLGKGVVSAPVDNLLKSFSGVPTEVRIIVCDPNINQNS